MIALVWSVTVLLGLLCFTAGYRAVFAAAYFLRGKRLAVKFEGGEAGF